MILFHGTNVSELNTGKLAKGSWLTSDIYVAANFSSDRGGGSYIYVFWVEEKDVEYHVFPNDVIPAWRLKEDCHPIARLFYIDQKIIA